MKRQSSFVQLFMVLVLVVCMNLSPANVAAATPQDGNAFPSAPQDLDKLLAPVALYPDALLMQVLAASVNSQEVLDGGNWLLQNQNLQGGQIDSAAQSAGFGPAMTALFHFPQVVDMMCSEIDWTRQLGAAFSANQSAVLDSVQRLRFQAKQVGNLQTTPQQTVATQQANGQQVIVIQPVNPEIIYVPQYNPVQVYVAPAPQPSATAVALVAFGVGITVGALFSSNNYYYPRWGSGGGVYYRGGPWAVQSYVYRPVYGPAFRHATVYRRPVNYPYAYNRPYPGNTRYNSGNYYNSYRGNTNVQNKSNNTINRNVSGNNVTINTGNQVNNSGNKTQNSISNSGNKQTNQSYKGQTTYNGGSKTNSNSTYNGGPPSNSNSTYNGVNKNNGNSTNSTYNGSRNSSSVNSTAKPSNQANTRPAKPASSSAAAPKANSGRTPTDGKQGASSRQGDGNTQDRKRPQQQESNR